MATTRSNWRVIGKALIGCAFVACGLANASVAHAHEDTARLSVSVSVVSHCNVASQSFAADQAATAVAVQCARNEQATVEQSAVRTLETASFSGKVMLATVNF